MELSGWCAERVARRRPVSTTRTASSQHPAPAPQPAPAPGTLPPPAAQPAHSTSTGTRHPAPAPAPGTSAGRQLSLELTVARPRLTEARACTRQSLLEQLLGFPQLRSYSGSAPAPGSAKADRGRHWVGGETRCIDGCDGSLWFYVVLVAANI